MSVSQPLAADDAQLGVKSGPSTAGQSDRADSEVRSAAQSNSSEGPHTTGSDYSIRAPKELGLDTRIEFRHAAFAVVERIPAGSGRLVVDCSSLASIDSAGLNALIVLQRKAEAKRVPIALKHLREELCALLVLTKLDDLFELGDG